jgi:hypothetical protein
MYAHFEDTVAYRLAISKVTLFRGVQSRKDPLLSGLVLQGL